MTVGRLEDNVAVEVDEARPQKPRGYEPLAGVTAAKPLTLSCSIFSICFLRERRSSTA